MIRNFTSNLNHSPLKRRDFDQLILEKPIEAIRTPSPERSQRAKNDILARCPPEYKATALRVAEKCIKNKSAVLSSSQGMCVFPIHKNHPETLDIGYELDLLEKMEVKNVPAFDVAVLWGVLLGKAHWLH